MNFQFCFDSSYISFFVIIIMMIIIIIITIGIHFLLLLYISICILPHTLFGELAKITC